MSDQVPIIGRKKGRGEGIGVIGSILVVLQSATVDNPATFEFILGRLREMFPNRLAKSMAQTIRCQCTYALSRKGHNIKGDKVKGFWIDK